MLMTAKFLERIVNLNTMDAIAQGIFYKRIYNDNILNRRLLKLQCLLYGYWLYMLRN